MEEQGNRWGRLTQEDSRVGRVGGHRWAANRTAASSGHLRGNGDGRRRFRPSLLDSFIKADVGGEGEHRGITGTHGAASNGGTGRPTVASVSGAGRSEAEGGRGRGRAAGERGRHGGWGLIPMSSVGRRRSSLRGSTASIVTGSCLPTEEDDEERRWAGPGWATICCAARQKREGEERTWAGFGQERKK
jgi:hypothetical protein